MMSLNLNESLLINVINSLEQIGDLTRITSITPVGGGCIHRVFQIKTEKRSYLLKWNPEPLESIIEVEAKGLKMLSATETIRTPEVIATHRQPDFILLEWIQSQGSKSKWDQAIMGRQLAMLHRFTGPGRYGLEFDNYIGSSIQINAWHESWLDFYRECRLMPQIKMATRNGLLSEASNAKLSWIVDHLDRWIDERHCQPSLLHGDLWGGNVINGPGNQPVLIDPAVYYGDREAELAFTELFGGFSRLFYESYNEVWPTDPGYQDRRDLYNLYQLLNHLNLFGTSYASQVSMVIAKYSPH
jgi:fructosamine-3-kinase